MSNKKGNQDGCQNKTNQLYLTAASKYCTQAFSALDLFGQPVTLKFKGRDTFQTNWGAFVTLCLTLALIWITLNLCMVTFNIPVQ